MRNIRTVVRFSSFLVIALATVGCGSGEGRLDVYPVTGSVTVNGARATGVQLVFLQSDSADEGPISAKAQTNADGSFVLSTYEPDDGIPAGEYTVIASWKELESSDEGEMHPDEVSAVDEKLDPKFTDPALTPLRVTIQAGSNLLEPFALDLAPDSKKRKKRS